MQLEIVGRGFEYRLKVQYHSMTCPLRLVTTYHGKFYNAMHWAHSLFFFYIGTIKVCKNSRMGLG